jgi:hypothetical protein
VGLESVVLGGMGLATVLMLRGHLLLHASAVVRGRGGGRGGRQVGMGKSTVATLLCGSGALMVTDDVLRVDLDEPAGPWYGEGAPRPGCEPAPDRGTASASRTAGHP